MEFWLEREKDKSGLIRMVGNFPKDRERKEKEKGRGRGRGRGRVGSGSGSGKEKGNWNGWEEEKLRGRSEKDKGKLKKLFPRFILRRLLDFKDESKPLMKNIIYYLRD